MTTKSIPVSLPPSNAAREPAYNFMAVHIRKEIKKRGKCLERNYIASDKTVKVGLDINPRLEFFIVDGELSTKNSWMVLDVVKTYCFGNKFCLYRYFVPPSNSLGLKVGKNCGTRVK